MIYRLSADRNPLHVDPDVAKAAGYPQPILHGLGTFGVVGHALLKSVCDYDPARVKSFAGRFSAPVFPGETIRTEFWRDGDVVSFRASVPERNVVVMNNGRAEVRCVSERPDTTSARRSAQSRSRALCAGFSAASTGASSIASAPIRPSSSPR